MQKIRFLDCEAVVESRNRTQAMKENFRLRRLMNSRSRLQAKGFKRRGEGVVLDC